ncbi:MAG: sulfite exporter TauE/SafE family protein [Paracoccaceae bacterium]
MEPLFLILSGYEFVLVLAVATLAGLVKGLVGFAMPMILVSGLSTFLPPDWALAGLILPTLVTNGLQALRQGSDAAIRSILQFRVFLLVGLVCLLTTSQLVTRIPAPVFLLLIAIPVVVFATLQLLGLRLRLNRASMRTEAAVGAIAGCIGGVSGVWGPPTVAYLTALNTPKQDQMRIQGVIYGLGAVALAVAHLGSGVLRVETAPLSLVLVVPAVVGMWLGGRWQDRIDQTTFRMLTLIVLLVAGLNLLRRAVLG